MAYTTPGVWDELTRFNVDFSRVAEGSSVLSAGAVESALTGRGLDVKQVEVPGDRGLFIEGRLGERVAGPLDAAVPELIAQIGEALGIPDPREIRPKHIARSATGTHVKVEQTLGGIPIYGAELTVHFDPDNLPFMLSGRPMPEAAGAEAEEGNLAEEESAKMVIDEFKLSPATPPKIDRLILPVPDGFIACHQVKVRSVDPFADVVAFVSTRGELLAVFNTMSAVRAEAQIFPVNPLRTQMSRDRLDNITVGNPLVLSGAFAAVSNQAGTDAASPNGDFAYSPGHPNFDEPCLYYFLDQAKVQLGALGGESLDLDVFSRANFAPMRGYVHVPGADDNAYYSSVDGCVYFGDINIDSTERYTARSRDIVIHEYVHALTDAICRLGRGMPHTQSRAMSEGYSDYFAASMLDDPVMGDYFMNDPGGFRNCDNDQRFPGGYAGEEHQVGEVWAGFLWSLRLDNRVGKGVADALALESLYYLGSWQTILQGVAALTEADRRIFPADVTTRTGRHEAAIRQLFDDRKPRQP